MRYAFQHNTAGIFTDFPEKAPHQARFIKIIELIKNMPMHVFFTFITSQIFQRNSIIFNYDSGVIFLYILFHKGYNETICVQCQRHLTYIFNGRRIYAIYQLSRAGCLY